MIFWMENKNLRILLFSSNVGMFRFQSMMKEYSNSNITQKAIVVRNNHHEMCSTHCVVCEYCVAVSIELLMKILNFEVWSVPLFARKIDMTNINFELKDHWNQFECEICIKLNNSEWIAQVTQKGSQWHNNVSNM